MSSTNTKAEELAGELDAEAKTAVCHVAVLSASLLQDCAAELRRLAAVEAENAKLREAIAENITSATTLTNMGITGGGLYLEANGGAAALLADSFAELLAKHESANYVELSFMVRSQPVVVTVQRKDKPTAHQFRVEAEAERDRLAAEVEALRADAERLDYLQDRGATVSVVHPFSKPYRLMVAGLHAAVSSDIRAAIDAARKEQG